MELKNKKHLLFRDDTKEFKDFPKDENSIIQNPSLTVPKESNKEKK